MHTDIEPFLEQALASVQPTSAKIGRVVVEPDYEAEPDPGDAGAIASQLVECIAAHPIDKRALCSAHGFEIAVGLDHPTLRKYVRCIVLHSDRAEGSWVIVAPPGNWI